MRGLTRLNVLAALGLAMALTACAVPRGSPEDAEPPGPKRVGVSQSLETYVVEFGAHETQLSEDNRVALRAFLRAIDAGKRDPITLANDRAMADAQAAERRATIAGFLRRRGYRDVKPDAVEGIDTAWDAGRRKHGVLVQVLRYRADLPTCPDLSRTRLGGFANLTSSNFGCATARNLGLMVAEPRDLEAGRDPGPADGERLGDAIERYRNDQVKTGTDLETEATGSGG